MLPILDGEVTLKEMIVPTVPSGTAGATNGSAVDLLGYNGRALVLVSALSAGAGNTMKIEIQTDSSSSFNSGSQAMIPLYDQGKTTSVLSFTTAAATAMLKVYSIDINACMRYVRCIFTSAGTTIVGAVHAVAALPGHRVLGPSGPGTTS